jgi:DNA ligase (NAD+)
MKTNKDLLKRIENNALEEGQKLTQKQLENVILEASNAYYNTESPILSDMAFDTLFELLNDKYPNSSTLDKIGSQIPDNTSNKVALPYHLGSMDKIKPGSDKLRIWLQKYNKGPYCISEKLDGISGLLVLNCNLELQDLLNNDYSLDELKKKFNMKFYTRGNGKVGQDISHLIPYINYFPDGTGKTKINNTKFLMRILKEMKTYKTNTINLRGEIIISKDKFEKKYQDKYPKARSLVAGIVNSKPETIQKAKTQAIANDLQFVIYQVITPSKLSHFRQFDLSKNTLGMLTANFQQWFVENEGELTSQRLQELLISYKTKSNYDIDGIIIADDSKLHTIPTSGNPKYAVAFKMILDEQVKTSIVEEVEYNVSKNGILKPRVKFRPVKIGGDTIMFATGFNAKFIKDNKIGVGASIKVIRSGDVIPYIASVLKPSKSGKWQEPSIPYFWNDTKVDAVAKNMKELPEYQMKQLYQFFTVLEVDGMKTGTIERLMNAGFDTISLILDLEVKNLLPVDGFQLKSATKLVDNIKNKILNVEHPLYKIMNASNVFTNFGLRKLMIITQNIPQQLLLKKPLDELTISNITKIDGFSTKTGMQFLNKLDHFRKWLEQYPNLKINRKSNNNDENSAMIDLTKLNKDYLRKNVVLTGFRDKELEKKLVDTYKCKIQQSVRNNTNMVITKDITANSSKLITAKDLGIRLIYYSRAKIDIM